MPSDSEARAPEELSSNGQPQRDAAASNSPQPASFEAGLAQLTELVNRLETGGLGLSASIDAYERGVVILRQLHEELARAEARVRMLTAVDDEGRPIAKPLATADGRAAEPESSAAPEVPKPGKTQPSRGKSMSKSTRAKTLPGMDDSAAEV